MATSVKQHQREDHVDKNNMEHEQHNRSWLLVLSGALLAVGVLIVRLSATRGLLPTQQTSAAQEPTQPSVTITPLQSPQATTAQESVQVPESTGSEYGENVKLEVFHFHGTHQCYSCKMVGALAEKTVNTHFADELDSEQVVFAHINAELPQNRELVMKYGATGPSLWIGTYVNSAFHKEVNINVWYKIGNEPEYLEYLKGILEKRLSGDLS